MKRALKPRSCAAPKCSRTFTPRNGLQRVCSPSCAIDFTQARQKARERKASRQWTRAQKEALKTKPMLLKEAQASFNAYIRARDAGLPCISCGQHPKSTHLTGGSMDCGHYLSVGSSPALRFHEQNAHAQCKRCNRDRSGNHGGYRRGLIKRIGLHSVEWLEGPHAAANWTRDDLRQIRDQYRRMANELRKAA